MAQKMTPLQLIAFGILFLRSDAQPWKCAAAERCAMSLERDFKEAIANQNVSHTINFCLKKTKEFRTVCLIDATIACKWGGNEDEYYRLQDLQRNFQKKCSELCPVTKEIQACSGLVNYAAYINKKFQDFCDSYKRSVRCKDKTLAGDTNCSFGEKLYSLDFEQDTLRVFNYICDSGCDDIDTAWSVLERCTSTHNLNNAAPGCKTYQDLELCLSTSKSCPQIHRMAPYFARNYTDYMMRCPLPMPVRPSSTTLKPAPTSTAFMDQETTEEPKPDENVTVEKDLTTRVVSTKRTALSSSTKEISTGFGFGECLTTDAPLGLLYSTDSQLCDSVRCLKRNGVVPDEMSSVNVQKDLQEKLIAAWDSCEEDGYRRKETSTENPDVILTRVNTSGNTTFSMKSTTLVNKNVDDVKGGGSASDINLSSTVTSSSKAAVPLGVSTATVPPDVSMTTVPSGKVSSTMDNTNNREIVFKTKSSTTGNPALGGQKSTDEIILEIVDEESKDPILKFDTQSDSSTSKGKTDRITTNPFLNVKTSIRPIYPIPISSHGYESTTPSLEIQTRSKTTITTSGIQIALSQGLQNGSSSLGSLDVVLYVAALITAWCSVS